ncbi:MAG: UDP-N-acetylglucosamine 2-epimerase (non-hydrolyzing) [Anaerolineales bacterium]|nr:UDP-N-acetylglucosamine 2-epimerase (non-hydrolyzing) [Anaerolineales bacterium]MCW5855426.1 UDP-N-acetylglucosamine 2-epimerase (non-hydrolyzing) [Anaerolineales bacterium]
MPNMLTLVVGARPNFMKAAPLMESIAARQRFTARLVHTGQHFDANMSQIFFEQLGLPQPDVYLNIQGGSPAEQIGRMVLELEKEFQNHQPEMVVVFGDVNSTLAAAVVANKLNLPLAHVEAGLRSFDRSMPEEHNRIVTDMLADVLFTPSPDGDENLLREGVAAERIFRVGNIMVDSLKRFQPVAEALAAWETFGLPRGRYGLITLHRPANVDDVEILRGLVDVLVQIQKDAPLIFPVHPRTREKLRTQQLLAPLEQAGVLVAEPIGYLEFLSLMTQARFVLTDSGGIQEETTMLGVPCLTARENTERPITISQGTNRLVGNRPEGILEGYRHLQAAPTQPIHPELWDGQTALRIEEILAAKLLK